MSFEQPPELTPEQITEFEKSRAISDANILKQGGLTEERITEATPPKEENTEPRLESVPEQPILTPEQETSLTEQRLDYQHEVEQRAEARNHLELENRTIIQRMKFWEKPPSTSSFDVAQDDAIRMNEEFNALRVQHPDLSEADIVAKLNADPRFASVSEEHIPDYEKVRFAIDKTKAALAENDFEGAVEALWKRGPEDSRPEIREEILAIVNGKFAELIRNKDIDGLEEFRRVDQKSMGGLGDVRWNDLNSLPGVTPEMIKQPEITNFFKEIVTDQLDHMKGSKDFRVSTRILKWREEWIKGGYISADEFDKLPVLKKIAKDNITETVSTIFRKNSMSQNPGKILGDIIDEWVKTGVDREEILNWGPLKKYAVELPL